MRRYQNKKSRQLFDNICSKQSHIVRFQGLSGLSGLYRLSGLSASRCKSNTFPT